MRGKRKKWKGILCAMMLMVVAFAFSKTEVSAATIANANVKMPTKYFKMNSKDGKWYYKNTESWKKAGWFRAEGKAYYLNEKGNPIVGWVDYKNKKYFCSRVNGAKLYEFQYINGYHYYLGEYGDGAMKTSQWISYSGQRYYVNRAGHRMSGMFKLSGKTYYCDNNGKLQTGWINYKGKKYYANPSDGSFKMNCWYEGYYLQADGSVAYNTFTPDRQFVGKDGHKVDMMAFDRNGLDDLEKQIRNLIAGYDGTWSVYVKDLQTGQSFSINIQQMYPASVIKLFTMAGIYNEISTGHLDENSMYSDLYYMITLSVNDCYNNLMTAAGDGVLGVGCQRVNQFLKNNGIYNTEAHHSLSPSAMGSVGDGTGLSNFTTAEDMGKIMEKIYRRQLVSPEYSDKMMSLLKQQQVLGKLPAGLSAGVMSASKSGDADPNHNDAMIVFNNQGHDYIICVMSSTYAYNAACFWELSSVTYQYFARG